MTDTTTINRQNWDDRVTAHQSDDTFYNIDTFKQGRCTLREPELKALGDVTGKSILHLQCHFGLDSLSWARKGAHVTGVDFSGQAIALAQQLSQDLSIPATFIQSDVLELNLNTTFDAIVSTYGTICWLSNLTTWANMVAKHLKQGGTFCLVDTHPFANALTPDPTTQRMYMAYSYFNTGAEKTESDTSYAGTGKLTHTTTYQWAHSLGDIFNALRQAGLTIQYLEERNEIFFKFWPHLIPGQPRWWKLPEGYPDTPLTLTVVATKEHTRSPA